MPSEPIEARKGLTAEVPVNLKDEDTFHITIEEYLHALVSMIEELARLAVNAVTLGDYARPLEISKFVKVGCNRAEIKTRSNYHD